MLMPTLKSPVVFVHGLLGFDYLKVGAWRLACYWSNLPEAVRAAGNRVLVAKTAPLGSVAERAGQLKAFLDEHCPDEPVHLLAHSMGGLDSRYLIGKLGMAERVLSLTTVATPHRGTPFADWGLRRLFPVVSSFFDCFGIPTAALRDLTVERCARFNEAVPDSPGVRYFSVAGEFEASWLTAPAWKLSWEVIRREQGANDGLVPVASASWGERVDVWRGDHLSLVNYPDPFGKAAGRWRDRTPAYAQLLDQLADSRA